MNGPWESSIELRLTNLEKDIERFRDSQGVLANDSATNKERNKNIESRLSAIESTLNWLVRLIIGGMLMAIIGFFVGGGFSA